MSTYLRTKADATGGSTSTSTPCKTWWCRKKRKILGVVLALATGGPVAAIIAAASLLTNEGDNETTDWFNRSLLSLEVPQGSVLDGFIDNQFAPFFAKMVGLVDAAILSVNNTGATMSNPVIVNINIVTKQIAILRVWLDHTTVNPPRGFTAEMIATRNKLVNDHLQVLEESIATYLSSKNFAPNTVMKTIGVDTETNTYGMVYPWYQKGITASYKEIIATEVVQNLGSDPVSIEVTQVVADAINEVSGTQQPANSSAGGKIVKTLVVLGLGFLIGKAATSSKKKSK